MRLIETTSRWGKSHPGAMIGVLQAGAIDNSVRSPLLDGWKRDLVQKLRHDLGHQSRPELLQIPALNVYKKYYRRFNKSYHVLLQLESILHKGRELPAISPLVDASFAAEMESLLLTASHDSDRLVSPSVIDVAHGGEAYVGMRGNQVTAKKDDMLMRDAQGVVCTIIYGQDQRTSVTPDTRNVTYITYCPPGISLADLTNHHRALSQNIERIDATVMISTTFLPAPK